MPDEIMPAPVAAITSQTRMHHGNALVDPYTWLQNKADPAVIAYLEAENAYARAQLQHTEALQEELFHELRSRIKEDDSTVPQPCGDYFYYWRTEKGEQYRIFCRKRGRLDGQEEVLIDENELAVGRDYCRVFTFEPSPDHTLLAYSVDTTGAWVFDLYIKDLRTGELVTAAIPNTAWSVAWASDCRTLFYTLFDEAHRPYQVYRHTIGDLSPADPLVYHEPDNAFSLEIRRTRSGAFLLLTLQSMSTSEVRYLSANHPQGDFQLIHPRQHWMEYYVEHHGDRFLIRSNEQAENFKLMEAPVASPTKSHWREVIPHRADTLIEDVSAFHDHVVVYERTQGLKQIRISAPDGRTRVHHVAFPEPVYTFQTNIGSIDLNRAFNTTVLRMLYSSLVTPESTIDYDMISGTRDVKKEQEIPSGYDPVQYEAQRLHATAPDGTSIPISLVYRTGLQRDGRNPTLLYGYGAYGYSLDPGFDAKRISLLDRGFVFAMAHVRGGSELGRAWYEQGRLVYKKNSFTDFIACAEHLVAAGYTMPDKLAILGGSAGGLLVSAVANLRPDLFKAVVAVVPFTNVVTAMLMPELPLTVVEYEQWGNPADPAAFAYMLSYSPYDNVEAKTYPHMLVKAGLYDLQVPYWDPAKWVAKLRALKTDDNRLLLVTNMAAGHSGASGRYDHLREDAQMYAFLIDTLNARTGPARRGDGSGSSAAG